LSRSFVPPISTSHERIDGCAISPTRRNCHVSGAARCRIDPIPFLE
jgi:hypothetical protein